MHDFINVQEEAEMSLFDKARNSIRSGSQFTHESVNVEVIMTKGEPALVQLNGQLLNNDVCNEPHYCVTLCQYP